MEPFLLEVWKSGSLKLDLPFLQLLPPEFAPAALAQTRSNGSGHLAEAFFLPVAGHPGASHALQKFPSHLRGLLQGLFQKDTLKIPAHLISASSAKSLASTWFKAIAAPTRPARPFAGLLISWVPINVQGGPDSPKVLHLASEKTKRKQEEGKGFCPRGEVRTKTRKGLSVPRNGLGL